MLRTFFGYYGSKWTIAGKHYPAPRHGTIVEPFAGSAGYSLRYPDRKVILFEIDPVIAEVWRYLIHVKPEEILSIPDIGPGETVDDLQVSQEAKWLAGLWLNACASMPRKSPSVWMRSGSRPNSYWGERVRIRIASQVGSIRHWEIHNQSYSSCPNLRLATWFVDPPYEAAGKHYRFGSKGICYRELGEWCTSRHGQVIVCEASGATWLPFRDLTVCRTARHRRPFHEAYWLNDSAFSNHEQEPVTGDSPDA